MTTVCRTWAMACSALVLAACAAHQPEGGYSDDPGDPWEATNRTIYAVNTAVDRATLRPLAKGYKAITPGFVRTGISNVFSNLAYPTVVVNSLLQGKFKQSGQDLLRFGLNSTLGLAGLVDVASDAGLTKNNEDFGQTLAVWGVPAGPYVQLPLMGPSSLRDAPSLVVDYFTDGLTYVDDSSVKDKLRVLSLIDARAGLLSAEDALLKDAYDPYLTLREAWTQRREYLVYDGEPPEDDDFFDEAFLDDDEFLDEELD